MKKDKFFQQGPHDPEAFRIASLVVAFIYDRMTIAEERELDEWVEASLENQLLFEQLIDRFKQQEWLAEIDVINAEATLQKARKGIGIPNRK